MYFRDNNKASPTPASAFIYTEKFDKYTYGDAHPLKMIRLKLTYELIKGYGLLESPNILYIESEPAREEDVLGFHTKEYIDVLKAIDRGGYPTDTVKFGLGWGDNPIIKGIYEGSLLSSGGSIQAAEIIAEGKTASAFNIAGGLHHAMPNRASGFCYINDPVLAIKELLKRYNRIAYIDIDAHHGDGVQYAFYDTDKVLTISLHETGTFLFPGTGFTDEIGAGKGKGFSVNLPFYPGTDDEIFVWGFNEIVPPLIEAFKPDAIVAQLGVDTMATDPLTHLELTTNGFCEMVQRIKGFNIPLVALGGGGYNVTNVARCWTLTMGILAGVELPDAIPEDKMALLRQNGFEGKGLRDPLTKQKADRYIKDKAAEGVDYIRKEIFPFHNI
ncbi:MAG: acetoin utilization protein AcuC [Nitrospirota bacterium]